MKGQLKCERAPGRLTEGSANLLFCIVAARAVWLPNELCSQEPGETAARSMSFWDPNAYNTEPGFTHFLQVQRRSLLSPAALPGP